MAIQSSTIIHSDEKRHKCHFCGAVRYESFMRKLEHLETKACSQWGNDEKCWACKRYCYNTKNYPFK